MRFLWFQYSSGYYNFTRFEKLNADEENWHFETRKKLVSAAN